MISLFVCDRPVIAVVAIELQIVDQKKLAKVHNEKMKSLGPANPTVVIEVDHSVCDLPEDYEINVEYALEVFQQCGDIVLIRQRSFFLYFRIFS